MKKIEIDLPDSLFLELEKLRKESGLLNFNDFLIAILQNYLDQQNPSQKEKDEQDIEKRLKDLGYM
ncbi:hypothetical protein Calab_3528 [Caldithrix abyssi DSM 13497]|uniref:CopG family transcriptional regulator n=1 Tax=Caldithrix abyssi DSM 13497 TaxID=880073 RepID=H1XXK3_CALAY|nr:hypothetical protein [Caldithrix abyssi]APF19216.1 hypothetical protein Cabys_2467 [Caldithrix abyssi DSM 13497]EHO43127.1 hypothetical protein Calab_3528 [Caldithrix abyssi DSM 13497]